jgi:hypothetical protein
MRSVVRFFLAIFLVLLPPVAFAAAPPAMPPVAAVIETTLSTSAGQIRQFAFDGDSNTYFASKESLGKKDHFTLTFDKAVAVKSIVVTTGRPDGGDRLDAGTLESSADGKKFEPIARFADGVARTALRGENVQAIRIRAMDDQKHPLTIREIAIDSKPSVAIFRYPVEFVVDVRDATEMKEWAEKVARICERAYPMINEELRSDGFKPPHLVRMTLRSNYRGVAMAGGSRITGSVKYFKARPEDVGAMVHETVHIVQHYRTRNNPGWLVEGIADYVRFFKYEPGKIGRINPNRARYNGSYRVTAAFLAYLTKKYDRDIVRKLNQVMREGEYEEAIFKRLTGKTVQDLDREWRGTLRR